MESDDDKVIDKENLENEEIDNVSMCSDCPYLQRKMRIKSKRKERTESGNYRIN